MLVGAPTCSIHAPWSVLQQREGQPNNINNVSIGHAPYVVYKFEMTQASLRRRLRVAVRFLTAFEPEFGRVYIEYGASEARKEMPGTVKTSASNRRGTAVIIQARRFVPRS